MADSEEIKKLLKEAEDAQQQGNLDGAIELCRQAIGLDDRSVPAYTRLAELYVLKNDPAQASSQYLFIAKAYYDSKLMKGALKHYQKVLELDETNLEARLKLAEIYEIESMEREAKLETFKIAEVFFEKGDMVQAETYAQKALALKSIEARHTLALIHLKRDMVKEAISELEQLVKFKPNHADAFNLLGQSYLKMNRAADAATAYEKAKKLKPNDPVALEGLATAFLAKNSPIDALTLFIEAAEAAGKAAELDRLSGITKKLLDLAALFQKNKDIERATTIYQSILTWDPDNADSKSQLPLLQAQASAAPTKVDTAPAKPQPAVSTTAPASASAAAPAPTAPSPVSADPGTLKESEELLVKADGLVKIGSYQEAIDIYRNLTKRHPENMVIRKKLHEAYLLAAQAEGSGDPAKPASPKGSEPAFKKKGVKVSYL